MNPQQTFYWALAGIASILLLATFIGWLMARRAQSESSRNTVANLNARIRAWWAMIALFGFAFWLNKPAVLVLFALVSFMALREFVTLTPTKPGDYRQLFLSFFIILPVQYLLIGIDWYGLFSIFIPVFGFLIVPAYTVVRAPDIDDFLTRIAKVQWGVMLAVYCISHAPALLLLKIPGYEGQNLLLLMYLLLIVQMSDVLQYVFGKLFGKTPVAPLVSPGKTVEGFIGGGLSATLLGAALWWMTPFCPLTAAGMSFVIVLMGFLGGLTLSAIKRSLGVKDWGTMIEGHGGVLDRLDSVSFAAPIFFHLTRYFFVP
jgi:phosphatidate cytidylyltransferase